MDSQRCNKPLVIFVLGGPGSGKSGLCESLAEEYSFVHLSAGELLRDAVDSDSDKGQEIKKTMEEGQMIAPDVMINILLDKMHEHEWEKSKFLIDGFPRDAENLETWKRKSNDDVFAHSILLVECEEEEMLKRLKERGKNSNRPDDTSESKMKNRIKVYTDITLPMISKIEEQNSYNLIKVNCNGTKEESLANAKEKFSKLKF